LSVNAGENPDIFAAMGDDPDFECANDRLLHRLSAPACAEFGGFDFGMISTFGPA